MSLLVSPNGPRSFRSINTDFFSPTPNFPRRERSLVVFGNETNARAGKQRRVSLSRTRRGSGEDGGLPVIDTTTRSPVSASPNVAVDVPVCARSLGQKRKLHRALSKASRGSPTVAPNRDFGNRSSPSPDSFSLAFLAGITGRRRISGISSHSSATRRELSTHGTRLPRDCETRCEDTS